MNSVYSERLFVGTLRGPGGDLMTNVFCFVVFVLFLLFVCILLLLFLFVCLFVVVFFGGGVGVQPTVG